MKNLWENNMSDDFRQKIRTFAERMVGLAPRCANEESTKLFLVLPFLNFLGYDDRNPEEVCPEHNADFSEKYKNRVDFAILKNQLPVIAIECKTLGMPLKDERGQLRSYFNAAPTVKMGVITDGLVYEFYADSDEPNMMDLTAFLSLDLRDIAKGKIEESVEEGLRSLQKNNFDPENIGAEAKRKLIFQNLVQQIAKIAEDPSESFVRILLQNAGLSHVRQRALAEYTSLTKNAFREFVNIRILQRLDLPTKDKEAEKILPHLESAPSEVEKKTADGIITTEIELEIFDYTKRRLAFLINDAALFEEISKIEYRDYKGKFVVFYKKERAGRLFDFYDDAEKKYGFDFGQEAGGEIFTDNLVEIDSLLLSAFTKRVARR
jgi:predicted type IV restriction endonuclease